MKKLLFFVALTSFMASHAMNQNYFMRLPVVAFGFFGQANTEVAQTPLGRISRTHMNTTTTYNLEIDDQTIVVQFNQERQKFNGQKHVSNHLNCEVITDEAEIQNLFNQYEQAFNASPHKTTGCSIQ